MTWERWRTIYSLFDEAVRCAPPDRDNLLSERLRGGQGPAVGRRAAPR